jgi:hypothetical protein
MNNTMQEENVLGSHTQELEPLGKVPFVDDTVPVTTGNEIIAFSTVESPFVTTVIAQEEVPQNLLTNIDEGRDHSVMDVLCREYILYDGSIPVGGTVGQALISFEPLKVLLQKSNVFDKISGFTFLRGTTKVRFEFSTLPTNTGGIMLSFYPEYTQDVAGRLGTVLKYSQVPNLQQSLTTAASLEIELPFISPWYARDLVKGIGDVGKVTLSRIVPSTGEAVAFKVYASLVKDDLHVQYPTPIAPATSLADKIQRNTQFLAELQESGYSFPQTQGKTKVVAKSHPMAIKTKAAPKSESVRAEKGGKISGILDVGAKIATVASGIPVIGTVASVAAPLLSMGAKLAGMFGFAKPSSDKPIRAIKYKPGDSHLASEGVLSSHIFSVQEGCAVEGGQNPFGSKADEMSFDAIMQTPSIIKTFSVTTAQAAKTIVYKAPLTISQYNAISTSDFEMTHQMWVASLFAAWNGTLNFDFDAFVTHFHRVKLRFIVVPNENVSNAVGTVLPSTFDLDKCSCTVVEFSGDNVNFSIQIEPRSNSAMKAVPSTNSPAGVTVLDQQVLSSACSYGTLLVVVEVPLKASTTVATTVHFAVSFSAEDVALSVPRSVVPFLPTTQSKTSTLGTDYSKYARSERTLTGASALSSNSVPIDNRTNAAVSTGENVQHFRQLLNGFTRFLTDTVSLAAGSVLGIDPGVRRFLSANNADSSIDVFDYIGKGYGFFKGGMNVRFGIISSSTDITGELVLLTGLSPDAPLAFNNQVINNVGYLVTTNNSMRVGSRSVPVYKGESVVDCYIPFYQRLHIAPNNPSLPGSPSTRDKNLVALYSYGDTQVNVYRNVADDFRFGFLLALPNFRVNTNTPFVPVPPSLALDSSISSEIDESV